MKSRKFMVILLILALCLSIGLTAVACKKPVEKDEVTQDTAMKSVIAAVKKRFDYGDTKKFGFSVNTSESALGQAFGFNLMGNIDNATAENNQLQLEIAAGENKLSLIADSKYLYAVSGENKYRYTGVNFGDEVVGKVGDFVAGFDMVDIALTTLNILVFDTYEVKDDSYVFSGKIDGLINVLYEVFKDDKIVDVISSVLDGSILTLTAQIKDGVVTDVTFDLAIASIVASINVTLKDIKFGTDFVAPIIVPSVEDDTYVTTQMINFMLDGTFTMIHRNADYTTSSVQMNWDLIVDMNPFDVIRSVVKHGGIEGLFKLDSTKFAFNVSHKCTGDVACSDFCKSKLGAGMGDFLSIAYDPVAFKDNNIKIALDIAYLLPKGILDETTEGMLSYFGNKNYITLSVDPIATIDLANRPAKNTVAKMAATSGLEVNPLALVANLFDLLKGISTADNGLTLDTKALYSLAEMFSTPESNLANILYKFLDGASMLNVKVNNFAYASEKMNNYDVKARFLQKSAADSSIKNFALASDPTIELICSDNAKVFVDEKGNNNFTFDAISPSAIPNIGYLTLKELDEVILVGGIRYTAKTLTGKEIDAYATIKSIDGLDKEKFGVSQKVKINVGDLSGSGISTLLGIVEELAGFKIVSGVFDATITLIRAEDIIESSFVMGGAITNGDVVTTPAFDPAKDYRYDEKFNNKGKYTVKFSYILADGSNYTQMKEVTASNSSDYMSSSSVKVFGVDYALKYKFYNEETIINVKTYKYNFETEVKCKPGYSSALSGFDSNVLKKVNNTISMSSVRMFYKDAEGADKYSNSISSSTTSIEEMDNMVVAKSAAGLINSFKFTAVGTYVVKGVVCGVPFTATYVIS